MTVEQRLIDAGYIKKEDYSVNECCNCAYKKAIDEDTRYCTKLDIYVGPNDVCDYFYDYLRTEKGRSQLNRLAELFTRRG